LGYPGETVRFQACSACTPYAYALAVLHFDRETVHIEFSR
jgi:hypothetical protein